MVSKAQIIDRLKHFGYTATDEDYEHIEFEIEKICNYVLNYCNITEIPAIVEPRIIDRICGEFLFYKKNAGVLTNFNYDAVVKEIKEGDTSLKYAVGQDGDTPESRFDAMVRHLERGFDKWITPHRRIRW